MASRVEFAVSATPIFTHAAGEGVATDSIAADVGRTVAGGGNKTVTWGSTGGYSAGAPTYVTGNGGTIVATSAKFIFIKHTGYLLNGTALGLATTDTLEITIGATNIAILAAGQAICLPLNAWSNTYTLAATGGDAIAVEYFWTA